VVAVKFSVFSFNQINLGLSVSHDVTQVGFNSGQTAVKKKRNFKTDPFGFLK